MCSIRLSSFLLPYDLACSGGKKLMPIHVSAELSHVCPLEDITAHAAALELGGFYRVWVPDTVVSPWEAWLGRESDHADDLAHTARPGSDQSLYAPSSGDGPDG